MVLVEEKSGELVVHKVPTIPEDPVVGVLTGVEEVLTESRVQPEQIVYFGAGSTLALNTIIERSGVKTGLLVTKGFRDVLEIRRTRLPDAPSFEAARPIPLVRRALVKEVEERIAAGGSVLRGLKPASVMSGVSALIDAGVEAVAICFLHAYANPEHERAARSLIVERWPDLFVCISAEIWPQQREYERTLVTVMNAYIGPRLQKHYHRLEKGVREMGINSPLLVTQSNGGTMSLADAAENPIRTLLSGPAAGVMASVKVAREADASRTFTLDMGGTSADMSVIDGMPSFSTESSIGDFPLFMPAIAIDTIGAGGGSIAWVDDQGVLKVGPRSAGAVPGPACYDRGGTEPTVTDAYLITGILGASDLLGGAMELSRDRAENALTELGENIGLTATETAEAVIRIATANMYAEFLPLIARHGVDQREFVLVPFGGAGPTHAFLLAAEAGIGRLLVPRTPGVMCALGAALADLQMDFVRSVRFELSDRSALARTFAELEMQAREWLAEQGLGSRAQFIRSADMYYHGQSYELTVELADDTDPAEAFHRRYEQIYGYRNPSSPIEVLQLRVLARVPNPHPNLAPFERSTVAGETTAPVPAERRQILYGGREHEVSVYRRSDLAPGVRMAGPAVVTQYDTTIFVTPGFRFWVDTWGNVWGEAQS